MSVFCSALFFKRFEFYYGVSTGASRDIEYDIIQIYHRVYKVNNQNLYTTTLSPNRDLIISHFRPMLVAFRHLDQISELTIKALSDLVSVKSSYCS